MKDIIYTIVFLQNVLDINKKQTNNKTTTTKNREKKRKKFLIVSTKCTRCST